MKYELRKTISTLRNGASLKSDDIIIEVLGNFDNEAEAMAGLKKYDVEVSKEEIDGVKCCIITEFILEKFIVENGKTLRDFVAGKVADLEELGIGVEVKAKE